MSISVGIVSDRSFLQQQNLDIVEYRDRAIGLASDYFVPAKAIDELIITEFDKTTVSLNALVEIGGTTGIGSTCYSSDTTYFATHYGDIVSGIGTTTGNNTGIVGIGSTQVIAFGQINLDSLQVYRYPKIENDTLDADTDNPFSGEGAVGLGTTNAGIGVTTVYTRGGGGVAGTVFAFVANCNNAGIAASIGIVTTRYLTIESAGIGSFVNAVNLVKSEKTEYQFHRWSYDRKIATNNVGITSLTSVLGIITGTDFGGPY